MKRTIFKPFKPFFPVSQHKQTRKHYFPRKKVAKHREIIIATQKNQQKSDRFSKNLTLEMQAKCRDQPCGGSNRITALKVTAYFV